MRFSLSMVMPQNLSVGAYNSDVKMDGTLMGWIQALQQIPGESIESTIVMSQLTHEELQLRRNDLQQCVRSRLGSWRTTVL